MSKLEIIIPTFSIVSIIVLITLWNIDRYKCYYCKISARSQRKRTHAIKETHLRRDSNNETCNIMSDRRKTKLAYGFVLFISTHIYADKYGMSTRIKRQYTANQVTLANRITKSKYAFLTVAIFTQSFGMAPRVLLST